MTELTNINEQDIDQIYPDFTDWVIPTDISLNRDEFLLRWKTINRIFISNEIDDIEIEFIDNLIISSLGHMQLIPDALDTLRSEMRKDDIMFPSIQGSRDEELKVLSSYCLRLLIDTDLFDDVSCSQNVTKILSASLNGIKSYKGGIDLVDFAKNKSFEYARTLRDRSSITAPTLLFQFDSKNQIALEKLDDKNPVDMNSNKAAILAISNELKSQLSNANLEMETHVKQINTENKKIVEELEILWFVNLCWCDTFDTNYSNLSVFIRIFEFASALSLRSHLNVELPSVKALSNKVGIVSQNINFREWVTDVLKDHPNAIDKYEDELSELTPCLYAIKLAKQGRWFNKWKEHIGLESSFEIDSLELTQQIYRELLVLGWS